MGLKKEILHNTYNEDDEKLPGRTVSIKTQEGGGPAVEYPIAVNKGGTGASTAAAARRNLGLGTVATENTVPVSKGGTGASDAAAARRNLGLGSVATEDIVPIQKGGTGSKTVAGARSNLGVPEYATGTWTAHIYNLDTKVMELPSQKWWRVGNLVFAYIYVDSFKSPSAINTMFQIRNLPMSFVIGGQIYLANYSGTGGTLTLQASQYAYFRPNMQLTAGTNYGTMTCLLIGMVN